MKVGLIGAGRWGRNILRNLHELGCLGPVCDVRQEIRDFVQSGYPQVEVHEDYEWLFDKVDAVAIATMASSHYAIAKRALEAGLHVFIEKPAATATTEAKELIKLAEGKTLMAGHILLYTQAAKELRALMPELGKVLYVHAQRLGFGDPRTDVDVMWDLAVHEVSLLVDLFGGRPVRVKAYGHDFSSNGIKDMASIKLELRGDVCGHIDVSWWYPHKVRKLVIIGERAMAVWDDQQAEYKLELHHKTVDQGIQANFGKVELMSLPATEPLRAELQDFISCCQTGAVPLAGPSQILEVTETLAAARQSLYRQEWQGV